MNPKFTLTLAGCICFSLLAIQPYYSKAAGKGPATVTGSTKEEERPISKNRLSSSRNNNAVKIYPHVIKKAMHVVAKANGKEIDFFVFDTEGTLLKHYKMNDHDHKKITGLERGKYIYHVFCGDEETATGKFDIR